MLTRDSLIGVLKLRGLRRAVRARLPHRLLVQAHVRALIKGRRLPPGMIAGLDDRQRSERTAMLELSHRIGPVFKAVAHDRLLVYVVGIPLGRRLLRDHGDSLQGMTVQVESIVPGGFIRAMQGDPHRQYRRSLMRAVVADDVAAQKDTLQSITDHRLHRYAATGESHGWSAAEYRAALGDIATGMLVCVVFGARPGTPVFDQLVAGFHALGPKGFEWTIGDEQRKAFAAIRSCLQVYCLAESDSSSILQRLHRAGQLDETMLGNLIYMVEMGRYDTRGLFRWLSKYAAEHPETAARIATEDQDAGSGKSSAEMFVMETLRSDQSEALIRLARQDIEFEGFSIPKDTVVRICMWESHHDKEAFPEPFRFRPERFQQPMDADRFAPFGLDQHQCPFGNMALTNGITFLTTLVRAFELTAINDGPPIRGRDLWEPAPGFSVRLNPRTETT